MSTDTIFALSSGAGPSAIAVVRVSGPGARGAADALGGGCPAPRRAALRTLHDPATGHPIDQALILFFPAPTSVTGEDVFELHVHGGRAVIAAVQAALAVLPGLRPATAGEFTWRAFANRKTDLVSVEGLADLLRAETEAQRRHAYAVAEGGLTAKIDGWQASILIIAALIESRLDFADEGDVETMDVEPQIREMGHALYGELMLALQRPAAEPLRDGVHVVIAGPPNAGKSTLLNRLVEREAAIVSEIPGTTRDLVEVPVVLEGIAYRLTDTAGLRSDTPDPIEQIGIDRATNAANAADIVLWLGDDRPPPLAAPVIRIHPRADLPDRLPVRDQNRLAVSALTGAGIADLIAKMGATAKSILPREDEIALSQRQRVAVTQVAAHLADAMSETDDLIRAEHMRLARGTFDRLTGRAGTEDMLDALFGNFCIGK